MATKKKNAKAKKAKKAKTTLTGVWTTKKKGVAVITDDHDVIDVESGPVNKKGAGIGDEFISFEEVDDDRVTGEETPAAPVSPSPDRRDQ